VAASRNKPFWTRALPKFAFVPGSFGCNDNVIRHSAIAPSKSGLKQEGAEIVMCVRIIGTKFDRLPKMSDCIKQSALASKDITDAVMDKRET